MMGTTKSGISKKRSIGRKLILVFCLVILASVAFTMLFNYRPNQNAFGALATVCMDVISILILNVLALSIAFEKGTITRTSKLFLGLTLGTMWGLIWDFFTWSADGSLSFSGWTYFVTSTSLCSGSLLALVFALYLSSYLDDMYGLKSVILHEKICVGVNIVAFIMTVILAVTKTAFNFVDGHYEAGAMYDLVTGLPVLSLLYMTVYVIWHIKTVGLHDVMAVLGYIFIMISGALIESSFSIGTTYVSVMIADIYIFVMLQNRMMDRVKQQKDQLSEKIADQSQELESMAGMIDAEKKNVEKWIHKSNTDELTGFLNRHAFEEDLAALNTNKVKDNFVYVSIDINSLKIVNDSLGHDAGDELIIGASECIKQCFGSYGKVYRTGGDEFVALIYADESQLADIKNDLDEITGNWSGKLNSSLYLSCGYVSRREFSKMSLHQMAIRADQRMYDDKNKFYQNKGIDRRGQRDAHVALCALYTKILKLNITEDSYQIVNMIEDEKTTESGFSEKLSDWFEGFGKADFVHPEDLDRFMSDVNLKNISNHFKESKQPYKAFYRRKINGEYKRVMMEIIPANNYQDDSQILFLYVKNIDE